MVEEKKVSQQIVFIWGCGDFNPILLKESTLNFKHKSFSG